MYIRKAILTIVSALCAVAPTSAQVIRGGGESSADAQPSKALQYVNPLTVEDAGRLADPVVIRIQGKYYLYATGGLAWSSDDLVHWNYHQVSMPEGSNIAAPGVFAYQGYVYLTGNYTGLFRSRDPLGPFEYSGDFTDENGQRLERGLYNGWRDGGVFDPMIFVDEDDRVYLYYAGRSINGIYGVELDPTDPTKFLGSV